MAAVVDVQPITRNPLALLTLGPVGEAHGGSIGFRFASRDLCLKPPV